MLTEEHLQWYEANARSQGLQGGAVQALTELCAEVRRLQSALAEEQRRHAATWKVAVANQEEINRLKAEKDGDPDEYHV